MVKLLGIHPEAAFYQAFFKSGFFLSSKRLSMLRLYILPANKCCSCLQLLAASFADS
jgi:hypothetical protein